MNTDIPVDLDIAKEEILRYFDTGQDTYGQRFLESMIEELRRLRERSKSPVLEATGQTQSAIDMVFLGSQESPMTKGLLLTAPECEELLTGLFCADVESQLDTETVERLSLKVRNHMETLTSTQIISEPSNESPESHVP